jgi:hypothetical protein
VKCGHKLQVYGNIHLRKLGYLYFTSRSRDLYGSPTILRKMKSVKLRAENMAGGWKTRVAYRIIAKKFLGKRQLWDGKKTEDHIKTDESVVKLCRSYTFH